MVSLINDPRIAGSNIHKAGVYRVGDREYFHKLEAFQDSIKSGEELTWHIFDKELAATDLTKEPEEDLFELYAQRARQLRNDYDHLVLHFSGGDDCVNIVETFYRAGVRLDQLFIRYHGGHIHTPTTETHRLHMAVDMECLEPYNLALPVARYIKNNYYPDIEITFVNITDTLMDLVAKDPRWYEKRHTASIDPVALIRSDYDLLHEPWQKMAESGKRIAHILGKEKPAVFKDEVGFFLRYGETNHQDHVVARTWRPGYPQYVELFYWDPSTIKMQLKQAHMIRRAWQAGNPILERTDELCFSRIHEDVLGKILYGERRLPRPIHTLKSIKDVPEWDRVGIALTNSTPWKPCSNWSVKDRNTDFFKNWTRGIFELYKLVKPLYAHSMSFWHSGFPTLSSPKHYIWYHTEEELENS